MVNSKYVLSDNCQVLGEWIECYRPQQDTSGVCSDFTRRRIQTVVSNFFVVVVVVSVPPLFKSYQRLWKMEPTEWAEM